MAADTTIVVMSCELSDGFCQKNVVQIKAWSLVVRFSETTEYSIVISLIFHSERNSHKMLKMSNEIGKVILKL